MKYQAFIFDLDGVLVDTAKYHFIAWKALTDELNINFTKKDNELLKGVSRKKSIEIILDLGGKTISEEEKLRLMTQKNEHYKSFIEKMTPQEVLPGVISFLEEVKQKKIKTAIGSASKNAPLILKKTHLLQFFDTVVDGNTITKAKPDPEVFITGANQLNVPYENGVVFEDSIAGIEAANCVNMLSVGVGDSSILKAAKFNIPDFTNLSLEKFLNAIENL